MTKSRYDDNRRIVIKKNYKLIKVSEDKYYLCPSPNSKPDLIINASAAIIWQLCSQNKTITELLSFLTKNTDANPNTLKKDIREILTKLYNKNIISFKQSDARPPVDHLFKLISHRRSGTHFLWELMRTNLGAGTISSKSLWDTPKSHQKYSKKQLKKCQGQMAVYIVRDCRDVLVANYNYFKNGGEIKLGMKEILQQYSFSEFIRGQVPFKSSIKRKDYFTKEYFSDPVNYWVEHTHWANKLFTVRFEDIISDAAGILAQIADNFQLDFEKKDYQPLDGLVGHLPRKGIVGDWQTWFTDDDILYVETIAGQRLAQLGYTTSIQHD